MQIVTHRYFDRSLDIQYLNPICDKLGDVFRNELTHYFRYLLVIEMVERVDNGI